VDTGRQASLLAAHLGVPVVPAYGSAASPGVPEAVAELRRRTGRPVAVASYLLAPGTFHDRLARAGAAWISAPLGAHPAVAGLAITRFLETGEVRRAA
jgi:sirohydrochlorin ferrochelatase